MIKTKEIETVTTNTSQKEYKDTITVFTAELTRKLLKEGYTIVDIKPDKNDPDRKKTLFIFKNENGLTKRIHELKEERMNDWIE